MKIELNQLLDVYVGSPTPDSIVCHSRVPLQSPVFEPHPGHRSLPAALTIEIMAQASGLMHMLEHDFTCMLYLARVISAEFRSPARPGDRLDIHSAVRHWGDGFIVCDAHIDCPAEARVLAASQLMLKCEPFLSDAMRSSFVATLPAGRQGPVTLSA